MHYMNIILVHGTWVDASLWSKIIPILQNAGHNVIPAKATGKVSGTLAQSSINSTSLIGPLKGKQMPDLISIMKNGQVNVNVHTAQNPPGEVRGTITTG